MPITKQQSTIMGNENHSFQPQGPGSVSSPAPSEAPPPGYHAAPNQHPSASPSTVSYFQQGPQQHLQLQPHPGAGQVYQQQQPAPSVAYSTGSTQVFSPQPMGYPVQQQGPQPVMISQPGAPQPVYIMQAPQQQQPVYIMADGKQAPAPQVTVVHTKSSSGGAVAGGAAAGAATGGCCGALCGCCAGCCCCTVM